VRVEEMVGQRMHDRREARGLTQEQLGKRVSDLLGRSWSRQAVSAAEKGNRAFTAAELVAIAFALGTNVGDLLTPQVTVSEVEMPAGMRLPRDIVVASVLPQLAAEKDLVSMQQMLVRIAQRIVNAGDQLSQVSGDIKLLGDQLTQAQHVVFSRLDGAHPGESET
jgi:transcriptional regulator with XRE-family HTH domain